LDRGSGTEEKRKEQRAKSKGQGSGQTQHLSGLKNAICLALLLAICMPEILSTGGSIIILTRHLISAESLFKLYPGIFVFFFYLSMEENNTVVNQ